MLTEVNGKLFGRGSTDDKGPVLGWVHAIEAFQQTGKDVPVNLKVRFQVQTIEICQRDNDMSIFFVVLF